VEPVGTLHRWVDGGMGGEGRNVSDCVDRLKGVNRTHLTIVHYDHLSLTSVIGSGTFLYIFSP